MLRRVIFFSDAAMFLQRVIFSPRSMLLRAVITVLLACAPALGQTSLNTVAGELKISELQERCAYEVTLAGKRVAHTDCNDKKDKFVSAPIPTVLVFVNRELPPFAQVVVFQQQMMGNACNGGPLWFLGLKPGGEFAVSEPIDFCGGRDPVLTVGEKGIDVLLPGGRPNIGSGFIPAERWRYENGRVLRVKPARKRPR